MVEDQGSTCVSQAHYQLCYLGSYGFVGWARTTTTGSNTQMLVPVFYHVLSSPFDTLRFNTLHIFIDLLQLSCLSGPFPQLTVFEAFAYVTTQLSQGLFHAFFIHFLSTVTFSFKLPRNKFGSGGRSRTCIPSRALRLTVEANTNSGHTGINQLVALGFEPSWPARPYAESNRYVGVPIKSCYYHQFKT